MLKFLVIPIRYAWDEIMNDDEKNWKGKKLKSILCKLAFGAIVYNIWKHQNSLKFCNNVKSEEQILQTICWEIGSRIMRKGKGKFNYNSMNVELCENLGILLRVLAENG
jgi:hypothetical protein